MKYVIELPEYIKHEVDIEEDVDKAEDFIKWYSATLTRAIKDSTPLQLQAEFDLDKMADRVAEKAFDEFTYKDKTLREWIEIIVAQDLLAIAELEKIKEEILNLGFTGWADKPKLDREEVLMILDKHISELSGENKQSRCNNCQNNADELSGECYECVKGIKDNHIAELKGENNVL